MEHLKPAVADLMGGGIGWAAVLLVAGWSILRWQQQRHRFELMKTALDKGITRFPDAPPFWLVSLRQGVTLLMLGVGLLLAGGGAVWHGHGVEMPTSAVINKDSPAPNRPGEGSNFPPPQQEEPPPPPPPEEQGGPEGGPPGPRPERGGPGFLQRRPPDGPPGERGGRPGPPTPHPELERWHRAQDEQTVGLVSMAIGLVFLLLGCVRIGFAKIEQRLTGHEPEIM